MKTPQVDRLYATVNRPPAVLVPYDFEYVLWYHPPGSFVLFPVSYAYTVVPRA